MGDPETNTLRRKVLRFAKGNKGTQVGSGQCFDLADQALASAGAKSARDFGVITPTADYKWGSKGATKQAQPGDVLQFRDHSARVTKTTKMVFPDGSELESQTSRTFNRGHHTAIATTGVSNGSLTVLESHVRRGSSRVDNKTGSGTIYVGNSNSGAVKSQVKINRAWAQKMKRTFKSKADKQHIEKLLRKYNGKSMPATVRTKVQVSGEIRVYSPVPKD